MGVGIGYTHRDNLVGIVKLFSDKGRADELTKALREMAQQRLSESSKATTLIELGVFQEEMNCKSTIRTQMMLLKGKSLSNTDWDKWADKNEVSISDAFGNIQTAICLGIALGGAFPDKAEQLWTNQYEIRSGDEDKLNLMRAAGLILPSKMPEPLSLVQFGEKLRVVVDAFVEEYRPDV